MTSVGAPIIITLSLQLLEKPFGLAHFKTILHALSLFALL